ncbi:MAG: hypothetical protein HY063_09755 [Bacteroidetes bacterium]|nr:hypothetical protein [Bacteroidota bacterium]
MKKVLLGLAAVLSLSIVYKTTAQSISAGEYYSLFACSEGKAMSCGSNNAGQLGNGAYGNASLPVLVSGLTNIIAVSASTNHSLFLKNDSTVWACGDNTSGQLGDGTTISKNIPVQVIGLTGIIAISAGRNYSLFLKSDSTVWACGINQLGELGDGTTIQRNTPVKIPSLSGIISISGMFASIFLKSDSTVWICGDNMWGELGLGTSDNNAHPMPVQITSLSGIIAISARGGFHCLFLKSDGMVWACGYNGLGELGDGTTTGKYIPVQVSSTWGAGNIIAVEGAGHASLFLKDDSTVWGCGQNAYGQLGDGTAIQRNTPVQASSLSGITAISGDDFHSIFKIRRTFARLVKMS